ncbi:MAG: hypothetical protein BMS9Abin33_0639 [Gammaproteobacteria bacterium]|nr:MAG: hypothetical protein BMS9Abin33_0639 [Gammaproteobacteria bacterium]
MTANALFYDVAITVVPIAIIGAGYYLLARLRRCGLSKAVHAAFGVTLAMLSIWGAYQLWVVANGDGWSGLIMLDWIFFGVPVAIGSFILIWSVVTLTEYRAQTVAPATGVSWTGKNFAIGFISLAVIALLGYSYHDHQLNIASNQNIEPERLRALYNSWYAGVEIKVLRNLAVNKATPVDVLQQLAVHDELWVRRNVCINLTTPMSVLSVMAKDKAWQVRWCVARHPNASEELLAQLANDQSSEVRRSLAYSTTVPTELLMKLSRDSSEHVRTTVAMNKATPVDGLVSLATDSSENVRRLVANRTDLPLKQRLQLAEDKSAIVRDALMHGGNTPIEVLNKLENDPDAKVRQSVKRRKTERKVQERNRK